MSEKPKEPTAPKKADLVGGVKKDVTVQELREALAKAREGARELNEQNRKVFSIPHSSELLRLK